MRLRRLMNEDRILEIDEFVNAESALRDKRHLCDTAHWLAPRDFVVQDGDCDGWSGRPQKALEEGATPHEGEAKRSRLSRTVWARTRVRKPHWG